MKAGRNSRDRVRKHCFILPPFVMPNLRFASGSTHKTFHSVHTIMRPSDFVQIASFLSMLIGVCLRFAQAKLNRKPIDIGIGCDVLCLGGGSCNIRSKIGAVSSPVRTEHHSCDAVWLLRFLHDCRPAAIRHAGQSVYNYCGGDWSRLKSACLCRLALGFALGLSMWLDIRKIAAIIAWALSFQRSPWFAMMLASTFTSQYGRSTPPTRLICQRSSLPLPPSNVKTSPTKIVFQIRFQCWMTSR